MEVLDSNNPVKDNEDQMTDNNYSCRLPRDLNIGSGSVARSKNESDVRLLVACKTQLSSEVIKWKTESLRLQKERDAARLRTRELDQAIGKYSERTKELESRLSLVEEENKRLKGKVNVASNANALKKLSMSLDKFHSYPFQDSQTNSSSSNANIVEDRKSLVPQEDWKEVSQKMLEKMKQEMKELQEMSSNFSLLENDSVEMKTKEATDVEVVDDKVDESLSCLISETISLKQCLLEQRLNLKLLLNKAKKGNSSNQEIERWKNELQSKKASQSKVVQSSFSVRPKPPVTPLTRHSDDSVREFFTKQLEGCHNIDKMSKTMQLFMDSDASKSSDSRKASTKSTVFKSNKPQTEKEKNPSENERVCPICQSSFDQSVPQTEFENHVLDHLEVESASLLDQIPF